MLCFLHQPILTVPGQTAWISICCQWKQTELNFSLLPADGNKACDIAEASQELVKSKQTAITVHIVYQITFLSLKVYLQIAEQMNQSGKAQSIYMERHIAGVPPTPSSTLDIFIYLLGKVWLGKGENKASRNSPVRRAWVYCKTSAL